MSKLHEILAVKSGVLGKFNKLSADLADLFLNKKHHFIKEVVVFKPLGENQQDVLEKNVDLQTTVRRELAWIGKDFAKLLDICNQINSTNTVAKADVVVDGQVILKDIPATGLLELEKYITAFKSLIEKIPTLDPIKGFTSAGDQGADVYKASPRITSRTTKEQYPMVLAPATDKHPAQVQLLSRDIITGWKHESEWSGMLTPSEKSALISKCEDLANAIKAAQSRANSESVIGEKIGQQLVDFILK